VTTLFVQIVVHGIMGAKLALGKLDDYAMWALAYYVYWELVAFLTWLFMRFGNS